MTRRTDPRRRVVEVVNPAYQPTRDELEEPIQVPRMPLREAMRRFFQPAKIVRVSRPPSR